MWDRFRDGRRYGRLYRVSGGRKHGVKGSPEDEMGRVLQLAPSMGIAYGGGDIFPAGEDGALKSVAIREGDDTMPIHLELTIEHSGKTASGILCCDDAQ